MIRKKIIIVTKEIVQVLNYLYVNLVERYCREQTTSTAKRSYLSGDITTVDHIIHHYEDLPSIRHKKER